MRIAGVNVGKVTGVSRDGDAVEGDVQRRRGGPADPRRRHGRDPAAPVPGGQLLPRPRSGQPVRAGARGRRHDPDHPDGDRGPDRRGPDRAPGAGAQGPAEGALGLRHRRSPTSRPPPTTSARTRTSRVRPGAEALNDVAALRRARRPRHGDRQRGAARRGPARPLRADRRPADALRQARGPRDPAAGPDHELQRVRGRARGRVGEPERDDRRARARPSRRRVPRSAALSEALPPFRALAIELSQSLAELPATIEAGEPVARAGEAAVLGRGARHAGQAAAELDAAAGRDHGRLEAAVHRQRGIQPLRLAQPRPGRRHRHRRQRWRTTRSVTARRASRAGSPTTRSSSRRWSTRPGSARTSTATAAMSASTPAAATVLSSMSYPPGGFRNDVIFGNTQSEVARDPPDLHRDRSAVPNGRRLPHQPASRRERHRRRRGARRHRPPDPGDGAVRRAIREHLTRLHRDRRRCSWSGSLVTVYILSQQQQPYPSWIPILGDERFELKAEISTAQAVTPGQGQTVNIAGRQGRRHLRGRARGRQGGRDDADRAGVRPPILRTDSTVLLRPRTGLQDMTMEIEPGEEGEPLEEGATIPLSQTRAERPAGPDPRDARRRHAAPTCSSCSRAPARASAATARSSRRRSGASSRWRATSPGSARRSRSGARTSAARSPPSSEVSEELGANDTRLAEFVDSRARRWGRSQTRKRRSASPCRSCRARCVRPGRRWRAARSSRTSSVPRRPTLIPSAQALGPGAALRAAAVREHDVVRSKNQIRPFARAAQTPVRHLKQAARAAGVDDARA